MKTLKCLNNREQPEVPKKFYQKISFFWIGFYTFIGSFSIAFFITLPWIFMFQDGYFTINLYLSLLIFFQIISLVCMGTSISKKEGIKLVHSISLSALAVVVILFCVLTMILEVL